MLYKIGTIKQLALIKNKISEEIFVIAQKTVQSLDKYYGAERDIDNSDGGYILIAENENDLIEADKFVNLNSGRHESVDVINDEYINILYLKAQMKSTAFYKVLLLKAWQEAQTLQG